MEDIGLTKLSGTGRPRENNGTFNFGEGDVRRALQRIFSPEENYVLFQTIANKEAVNILTKYVKDSSKKVRFPQEGDKISDVWEGHCNCIDLRFGNPLLASYEEAIDEIAGETLGEKSYASYPMVNINIGNQWRNSEAISWPKIYMVNEKKQKGLKEIIDNLSGDESFGVLKELESPQFYQMSKIELLHDLKIAPLVRLPQELKVSAQDLLKYVDFLAQMNQTYESGSGSLIDF